MCYNSIFRSACAHNGGGSVGTIHSRGSYIVLRVTGTYFSSDLGEAVLFPVD